MAIVQLRHDTDGRAYYGRRLAEGKTAMEAIRALKRRLSDVVYRHMLRDATTATATSPGGQTEATLQSSAADPNPKVNTSEQSHPGSADHHPRTPKLTGRLTKRGARSGCPPTARTAQP
jgi:hypothetical protein